MPIHLPRGALRRLAVIALFLGSLGGAAGRAQAVDAPDTRRPFDILVDGVLVGHQMLTFRHVGKDLVVQNEIEFIAPNVVRNLTDRTLELLHVERRLSEHYALSSREVWRNGALAELTTEVDHYGEPVEVDLGAGPQGAVVAGTAGRFAAPPGLVPSSLWQIEMTKQSAVLDLNSGRVLNVRFSEGAETPLSFGAHDDMPARRVAATGELTRDLWYGGDGLLLRQQYVDKFGQLIVIRYAP